MSTSATSQNLKAGSFVLSGIVLIIAVIFILSNAWSVMFGAAKVSFVVVYPVVDGVDYLSEGSGVRLGGLLVGKVESVALDHVEDPVEHVKVQFTMPVNLALYSNAQVFVSSAIIGNISYIDIVSVGWGKDNRPAGETGAAGTPMTAGSTLVGTISEGVIGSVLGSRGAADTNQMLNNLAAISTKLRDDGNLLPWAIGDGPAKSLTAGMTSIGRTLQKLEANGEVLKWAMGDASATSVATSLTAMEQTLASLQGHWPLWSSAIDSTLANLDLSGQQLNLMMQELRTSPWRLLYRPTEAEASNELLFEASRNFVFGAADLRSAAHSMDRLVQAHGDAAGGQPAFKLLKDNLLKAASRYEHAQQQLEQILKSTGVQSTP
jgi:ABC-type transporter Mla subunit MlaD